MIGSEFGSIGFANSGKLKKLNHPIVARVLYMHASVDEKWVVSIPYSFSFLYEFTDEVISNLYSFIV